MQLPPIDVVVSWPTPNYINPETRGNALVIVNYVFSALALVIVSLRLYTRIIIKRWFGIDDIFIILALIFTLGLTATVLLANQQYGWNRHIWDIPLTLIEPSHKIAMTAKLAFACAATFTRLSLHCFYYRLVTDTELKWFKWLVHANVAYTLAIFVTFVFLCIFQCIPVREYWTIAHLEGSVCLDEPVITFVCGITSCVADFVATITPMQLVSRLQMPRRQRCAVAMLFGLGFIVTIAGIVRTWFIYRSMFNNEWDQTWYAYPLWIAAAIEIDLGVICASAPILRPILVKIPFYISGTFSKASFSKKSSAADSHSSGTPNSSSNMSSKRQADTIQGAPELSKDLDPTYDLNEWNDLEKGTTSSKHDYGSEEGIVDESTPPSGKSFRAPWRKSSRGSSKKEDMTIIKTSEVELQISSASIFRQPLCRRNTP